MGCLVRMLAVPLHNGRLVLVEGEEVSYPEMNTPEWHAMTVKDKLISIILGAGHSLDDIEMNRIEEISKQYDAPVAPMTCHWACTGCNVCGSAGHGNSWF